MNKHISILRLPFVNILVNNPLPNKPINPLSAYILRITASYDKIFPDDCLTILITLKLFDKKSETADERNPMIELLTKNPNVLFLMMKY
jgi:hypothetical protein